MTKAITACRCPPVGEIDPDRWRKERGPDSDRLSEFERNWPPFPEGRRALYYESPIGLRATLRNAHLSVEDRGLWERLRTIIPPQELTPEGIEQGVTGGVSLDSPAYPVLRGMADAVKAFVDEPGWITAEIRPATPLQIDKADFPDPEMFVVMLGPVFTNAPPSPPVALIADPDSGEGTDFLLALAYGRGVPQDRVRAVQMLIAGLDANPEYAGVIAGLLAESDPAQAYSYALIAGAGGQAGAAALLDRIEARLSTEQILALQSAVPVTMRGQDAPYPAPSSFDSPRALREASLALEDGAGVPRDLETAWRLASLAAAAGDAQAQALMARLDARFGGDPAWQTARARAATQARADWVEQDLAARFSAR